MNSSRGDTLNERRFLQSRLALLGKVGGLLGAVALVISYALLLAMSDSVSAEFVGSAALTIVSLAIWSGIGIAVSTFASRVLYGLRDRVRRAHALGQYEIVGRIGAGSMGEVFLAKHALLQRPTAVKVLRAERGRDPACPGRPRRVCDALSPQGSDGAAVVRPGPPRHVREEPPRRRGV